MLELQEIIHQLLNKDSIVIQEEAYKVDNAVYTTDEEILKTRILLKSADSKNNISIDVDIFAKIYKC